MSNRDHSILERLADQGKEAPRVELRAAETDTPKLEPVHLKRQGRYEIMGTLAEMRTVAGLVAEGKLKPVVDRSFPLPEARKAQEYLAGRKQFGKVVLTV